MPAEGSNGGMFETGLHLGGRFFLFARVVYVSMMIDLSSTNRTNFVKASCRGTSRGL